MAIGSQQLLFPTTKVPHMQH